MAARVKGVEEPLDLIRLTLAPTKRDRAAGERIEAHEEAP
jgi:hypothetical protein